MSSGLADGWNFPDALVGGALAGPVAGAAAVVGDNVGPTPTRDFLGGPNPRPGTVTLTIFRRAAAVADAVPRRSSRTAAGLKPRV